MANLDDLVQLQAEETEGTDAAFKEFYGLTFPDKLDALYELFSQISENRLGDGKHRIDAQEAGIQNGYDNAAIVMEYKEEILGPDNREQNPLF